jgi:hypothetical protein
MGAVLAPPVTHWQPFQHHQAAALSATAESQLIAPRQCSREKHCVLEGDLR